MRSSSTRKSRLIRSYLLPLFRQQDGLTGNLYISIGAGKVTIHGFVLHRTVKMSARIQGFFVQIMEANRQSSKVKSPGEEVNANATVRVQHRDDRQPTRS